MKISPPVVLAVAVLVSVFMAGCTGISGQAAAPGAGTVTITDMTDTQVKVPKYPKEVISLAPSETEIFCAVNTNDSGISLVGRTDYDDYPPEALDVPSVGGPQTLSVESIVAKDPDLILATTLADKTIVSQLRNLGYPVLVYDLDTFDDVYRNIDDVGCALGLKESSDELICSMKEKVAEIQNMPKASVPPKTMYVVAVEPLYVAGANTLQDDMITLSGGDNVFSDLEGYFVASDEAVIERAPGVIIVPSGHGTMNVDFKGQFLSNKQFSEVPAVKNNRVYTVEDDPVSRPGPRITDGLELFYKCINDKIQ